MRFSILSRKVESILLLCTTGFWKNNHQVSDSKEAIKPKGINRNSWLVMVV
jgi:hypothetical protein